MHVLTIMGDIANVDSCALINVFEMMCERLSNVELIVNKSLQYSKNCERLKIGKLDPQLFDWPADWDVERWSDVVHDEDMSFRAIAFTSYQVIPDYSCIQYKFEDTGLLSVNHGFPRIMS